MSRLPARLASVILMVSASFAGIAFGEVRASTLYPGHSGIWFDPSRNGEGYVLEIISPTAATLTWFTYDEQGRQRWLVGVGDIDRGVNGGTHIVFPELYDTSGGVFGDSFDPELVERRIVGAARVEFVDCMNGQLSYEVYGVEGVVSLERIAKTMGLDCAPVHGEPGAELGSHAGLSGSWYDVAHSGEGFQLQWSSRDEALLTWYSYDGSGRQYWMTGVGTRQEGDRIVFPSLIATRGARFGAAFDPEDVERFHWGNLTFDLDCSQGLATYTSDLPGFEPGEQTLTRLTALLGVSCPWTHVSLTDIYEVGLTKIPTEIPVAHRANSVQAFSIADDGTLIGTTALDGKFQLLRRLPKAVAWEAMTEHTLSGLPFQISGNASSILVNENSERGTPFSPLLFDVSNGWTVLSNLIYPESSAIAGSSDLSFVVGVGRPHEDHRLYPWIWSEATGQTMLARTEEIRLAYPLAVSNSGKVTIGYSLEPGPGGMPVASGVKWTGSDPPTYLTDAMGTKLGAATACSLDCRIVYGSGHASPSDNSVFTTQAWVTLPSGNVVYLDHVPDALLGLGSPYSIRSTTADGSLAAGSYVIAAVSGRLRDEAFLWTRLTGSVSLRELATALDESIANWDDFYAMDVSTDGSRVLLLGQESAGGASPTFFRAVVLDLRPRVVGVQQ